MNGDGLRWFDRQEAALQHAAKNNEGFNGVFVLQKFGGRRRFLSTTYCKFCEKYLALNVDLCHFYEVIRRDAPCRLYFDVDCPQTPPYYTIGSIVVDILINYVNHCLKIQFDKTCDRSEIMILDSSTDEKFSQHIIYTGIVFKDNIECGNFVKAIADAAKIKMVGGVDTQFTDGCGDDTEFLFRSADRDAVFAADLGVYTRNRHFRMWRSSKLDKGVILKVASENKHPAVSAEQVFFDSIVFVPGVSSESEALLRFETPERERAPQGDCVTSPAASSSAAKYPDLHLFVSNHIKEIPMYREATIDRVIEYDHGRWLNLTLRGSNWCGNIGEEHNHDRPYFSANLETGCLYTMCHSLKCRGYRSKATAIPEDILRHLVASTSGH